MFNSINYCDVTQPATSNSQTTSTKSNNGAFWASSFMRSRATIYSVTLERARAELQAERAAQAAAKDDWRNIGDDDPKPEPQQYRVVSLINVLYSADNTTGFTVKLGDVVNVVSQFSWGFGQMARFEIDGQTGWTKPCDLEAK